MKIHLVVKMRSTGALAAGTNFVARTLSLAKCVVLVPELQTRQLNATFASSQLVVLEYKGTSPSPSPANLDSSPDLSVIWTRVTTSLITVLSSACFIVCACIIFAFCTSVDLSMQHAMFLSFFKNIFSFVNAVRSFSIYADDDAVSVMTGGGNLACLVTGRMNTL